MIPIVACSIGSPSVAVFEASVKTYAKDHPLLLSHHERSSFGECYNKALDEAFQTYDEVIVANDDVVLHPETIPTLMSDVQKLKDGGVEKIGFVATMSDNVRASQNVRHKFFHNDQIVYGKWQSERSIKHVPVIAPIFAWLSKEAFTAARFAPITWYSDDVICEDLNVLGFKHFVSTAYIHHVGSSTIGTNYDKLREEALVWVRKYRPEYIKEFERRMGAAP